MPLTVYRMLPTLSYQALWDSRGFRSKRVEQ